MVDRPRVLVIGAGFAGLHVVRGLAGEEVDVLLVDRHNYHTFQPLLYQVATAGLEPDQVAQSVRNILQNQKNVRFRMGTVVDVNPSERTVMFRDGTDVSGDYLVVAPGATTHYFGVEGAREHAFPLKNLTDAIRLRSHVLSRFERVSEDPARGEEGALNFVIVGGGPTGVEMAGALVELFDRVLSRDFPDLNVARSRVILVEMLPHLLNPYADSLRGYTRRKLQQRGVELKLGESVVRVTERSVHLEGGETLPTRTLIWAAGVKAHPLADRLPAQQTSGGRVLVEEDLSLPGHPEVFLAGDTAGSRNKEGDLYPQLAPVAIQQGRHVAAQILRRLGDEPTTPFRYRDLGQMATIGRNAAVAQLPGGIRLSGWLAWVIWVFLHIVKIIGMRNRLMVFLDWVYNYFTYDRAARLILEVPREADDTEEDGDAV